MTCKLKNISAILILLVFSPAAFSLEPNEIVIIANSDIAASVKIARYYCAKRNVPKENILTLPLGPTLRNTISRTDYNTKLVEPIRQKLYKPQFAGKIRCLLTTYGLPVKVGPRGTLKDKQQDLVQLRKAKDILEKKT